MGYTTDFTGSFKVSKPGRKFLDEKTRTFLVDLNETRRMARKMDKKYGVEGEFFVKGKGMCGQDHDDNIIDYNVPPKTQPGLWCQWTPNEDGSEIEWDGGEKFYCYVEWLQYIIDNVLEPKDYKLNGEVEYQGEDPEDFGMIVVKDNVIKNKKGKRVYV